MGCDDDYIWKTEKEWVVSSQGLLKGNIQEGLRKL